MTGLLSVAGSTPSEGFELKSCRFDDTAGKKLTRTPSSDGNKKTWTISFWMKPAVVSTAQTVIFDGGGVSTTETPLMVVDDQWIEFNMWDSATSSQLFKIKTNQVFRDPAAWYHIVLVYDSPQLTAADRIKLYVNGSQVTSLSTANYPSQNLEASVNDNYEHYIGSGAQPNDWSGYLAQFYLIDGSALTPASFGETNALTNQWQPINPTDIKPTLTFGTNGFYLPFSNDALDDSFTDSSTLHSVHTVTAGGNAHTDTSVKKFGTASLQLDGTGDYLSVSNNNDFNLGTGDFTIDCWVQSSDFVPGADAGVIIHLQDSGSSDFRLAMGSAGRAVVGQDYGMSWGYNNGGSWSTTAYGSDLADGAWHHVACSRQGSYFYLFQDGVLVSTTTNWAGLNITGNATCEIGRRSTGQDYFEGYIDEIRVSKGIARWTSTFALETSAYAADEYTALLLHMDGSDSGTTFTDSSWTSTSSYLSGMHAITAYGDIKNTRISNHSVTPNGDAHIIGPKVGSSAISFDGDGDYLSVASSTDFDFGTGDFTLEMWCNSSNLLTTTHVYLLDMNDGTSRIAIASNIASSNGIWLGTGWNNITDWAFPTDEWFHIAVCRQSGTGRAYLNGVLKSSVSSFTTNFGGTWTTHIGDKYDNGANAELEGYLDEIRLSNIARYPDGTTFTPSTTAFTSDANTKLLIHSNTTMGSTTFTDSSSGAHTITAVGAMKNVAPKIGTGMAVFDGTGDYLSIPDSADWDVTGTKATFEFWVSPIAYAGSGVTVIMGQDSATDWFIYYYNAGSDQGKAAVGRSGVSELNSGSARLTGVGSWDHIAIVKEAATASSLTKFYLNGVEVNSATGEYWDTSSNALTIGGASGGLNAYLDEIRISKVVRYTSTFTPSTTAFKDDKDTVLLMHMDGGGGIDPETNLPTLAGQGTYFWDASTNALFYGADGLPTNKSMVNFPGNGYLTVPASSDFTFGTGNFTIECWMFVTKDQDNRALYTNTTAADASGTHLEFVTADDKLGWWEVALSGSPMAYSNDAIPYGQWVHMAIVRNSTTFIMYIDGVAQTTTQTSSSAVATPTGPQWGFHRSNTARYLDDVYLDQMRISNSARYTSNFTPSTTPFTADANTKLLIQSNWSEGGLGADHSGNYNYWTPTNLGVDDMMLDTPLNNFCTLNPLDNALGNTLREGNLKFYTDHGSTTTSIRSTQGMSTGKWYAEFYYDAQATSDTLILGIKTVGSKITDTYSSSSVYSYAAADGDKWNGTGAAYGASFTVGDIIGIALDLDANTLTFYKNNVTQGTAFSGLTDVYAFWIGTENYQADVVCNFGQDSSFAGNNLAQGYQDGNNKGDFYYSVPAGYLALCTDNLPSPSISGVEAPKNFNTTLWTGDDVDGRAITGVGFQPDFTWIKNRTYGAGNVLYDILRPGSSYYNFLESDNDAAAIVEGYDTFTSFDSDGYTINAASSSRVNQAPYDYVGWSWKAGGAGVANTDGALNSTVSVNAAAGFSLVKYTGDGTNNTTVGHGLSQVPTLWITKNRDSASSDWETFTTEIDGSVDFLRLNSDQAKGDSGRTAPTASVFYVGNGNNQGASGDDYIAYCFHSVEGYSKIGSYVGNGVSNNGPFIYLGFRPAYLLVKNTSTAQWWVNFDDKRNTYNPITYEGYPNSDVAEGNNSGSTNGPGTWLFVSNGLKSRRKAAEGGTNTNGDVYLYYAVAETPFKTSNAR